MASMMSYVFWNKSLSKHVKKLLYMAIPMNLLFWGCETWALRESDHRIRQVFHTSSIRHILNINMMEVQMYCMSNEFICEEFHIDPMENILASRQLRWLGKVARMEETRLPPKFIGAWHINPRPTGRPQQTIRHTYLHVLCLMGTIPADDKEGKFSDWFPKPPRIPKIGENAGDSLHPISLVIRN
eukprot:11172932-Ditylum_brightwellii.AAC.1